MNALGLTMPLLQKDHSLNGDTQILSHGLDSPGAGRSSALHAADLAGVSTNSEPELCLSNPGPDPMSLQNPNVYSHAHYFTKNYSGVSSGL